MIKKKSLTEINTDLTSKYKMFRLLQGDVGSGKTIVALISALNVVESGYQVAFMAPTEILARQHYNLAKNSCFFSLIACSPTVSSFVIIKLPKV